MLKNITYRPVAFELMQYFYAQANEPLIHAYIRYSSQIDERTLADAVSASVAYVPLLSCVFSPDPLRPRWRDRGFTGADIVSVRRVSDAGAGEAIHTALTASLSVQSEPQLRLTIVRTDTQDTLCILVNHMVCDGAGFKQYLYLLTDLYNRLCAGLMPTASTPTLRSARRLFAPLGFRRFCSVLFRPYPKLFQPESFRVPLADNAYDPAIVTRTIPKNAFDSIKRQARAQGATLNDVFLTAYARFLARHTGEPRVALPCPVDLRKYLPAGDTLSVCNLTVNYVVNLEIQPDTPFSETLAETARQIARQKQSDECLKSVLLVGLGPYLVPFFLLEKLFPRFFTIPVVSYTNLGILDEPRLRLNDAAATEAYLTGAIKRAPYFQVSFSTFENTITLSSNLYGSDRAIAETQAALKTIEDDMRSEMQ